MSCEDVLNLTLSDQIQVFKGSSHKDCVGVDSESDRVTMLTCLLLGGVKDKQEIKTRSIVKYSHSSARTYMLQRIVF
jgi:hypothetical protein